MTPKRKETNGRNQEPVRFYKYVALTFLLITVVLLGVIVFMSSKRATITVIAKSETVEINRDLIVGVELDGQLLSRKVILTEYFIPMQTREEAAVARGVVTLRNETDWNQPLVATTRLLTPGGILFRMKEGKVVPAQGAIEVEVYADQPGRESEIGPSSFTIPGLREDKQKVVYAVSDSPMTGGVKAIGILGGQDWQTAEKEMTEKLLALGQSQLSAELPELAGVYKLIDYTVTSDSKIGDEVSEFKLDGAATVVGVFYDQREIAALVRKELEKRLLSGDELLIPVGQAPAVALAEYDSVENEAVLRVYGNGLVSLNPESRQLDKMVFFGKTRDEIRRYLLSLDHVRGVEVKFSPAWMQTVPHVPDYLTVVVKNVE